MSVVTVLSWNVRGLNSPSKRVCCLDILRRKRIDIALLQESHLLHTDVARMSNKYFKVAAYSSAKKKHNGTLIILRRKLNISILHTGADTSGRISHITVIIGGKKVTFVSVYAPAVFDSEFFVTLSKYLSKFDSPFIIGADMNAVPNNLLDRSNVNYSDIQIKSTSALNELISDFSLTDAWRALNPSSREYTFFSARHKSFSRIDVFLTSSSLLQLTHSADIVPLSLSDHHPNIAKITFHKLSQRAPRWRFNTTLLQNTTFISDFCSSLQEFLDFNYGSVQNVQFLWGAIKGFARSYSISFASHLNKTKLSTINLLEHKVATLSHSLQHNFNKSVASQLELAKKELNSILKRHSEFLIHRTRQYYYFHSSRPSHLLALKLRSSESFSDIHILQSPQGELITDSSQINLIFQQFYKELYHSQPGPNDDDHTSFLRDLNLPSLSTEEAETLGQPLTLEELKTALQAMKKSKAPGLDGIPPEFYLTFFPQIGPLLLDMFNKSIESGYFHRDANTAVISLLLKPGKDPTLPTSYRPLSLIGADIKLFAKILAGRLETYISKLIHCDQTGFIKSRFSSDNVRRLLHVLDHTPDTVTPCAILSLDAEKAFDRLDWNFLWTVLEIMGLGHKFINMIKVLYSNPSAVVITGANCSSSFPILRGSRQGCPLSPFLFALSLEPLAQAIRLSSAYSPIRILNTQHHISLYADDILLFVNNVPQTLPHLLTILDTYGSHSGYKVNKTKSALLPLNEPMRNLNLSSPIPVVEHFKYLGIEIYASLNKTVKSNFNYILEQVSNDLKKWIKMTDTLQTRISVIKMNIAPRFNFITSMIPLSPPTNFWKKLNSIVSFYLWKGKRPRYKYSNLQRCKTDGGLSLPNLKLYYYSFVLRALSVWLNPDAKTSWRPVEECIIAPHRLQDFIYSNISLKQCKMRYGPIISNLLSVWRDVEKITKVSTKWHKNSPIFHNYKLLTASKPFSFPTWQQKGINTLGDIIDDAGLRTFQDLQSSYNLPGYSFFLYLRLRSAMKTYGVPWNSQLSLHPLHRYFCGNMKTRGLVSAIYTTLLQATYKPLGILTIWEKELKLPDDQIDWQTVWTNIISSSKNPNHQLIHYNFVFKYYLTPFKRYSMHLIPSPLCTFCPYGAYGTFLHMFWECPKVYRFWSKVSSTLSEILGTTIPMSPQLFLLNDDSCCDLNSTEKKIWMAGTTAAKKLLALRWQPSHSLSWRKWILFSIDVINLELSTARIHGAKEKTLLAWENAAEMFMALL